MNPLTALVLLVAYVIVAIILAVPYIFLSGGGVQDFETVYIFLPAMALVVWIGQIFGNVLKMIGKKNAGRRLFWGVTTWFCLPIILNVVAWTLKIFGLVKTGQIVFDIRYISPILIPLLLILMVIVCAFVSGLYNWIFRKERGSSGRPPTNNPSSGTPKSSRRRSRLWTDIFLKVA